MESQYDEYYNDFLKINKRVSKSNAVYKCEPVPFLYIPKFFTKKDILDFNNIISSIVNLVNKTINLYFEKEEVRKLYNFDKRLEELILLESPYNANVPMGRFDIFYYKKGDYKFCELNTDGSSAMNEDMVLSNIISESLLFKKLTEKYNIRSFELFDTWVSEVENIKNEAGIINENPNVCILDFIKKKPSIEFKEFKKAFDKKGFNAFIADPRDLEFKEGYLFYNGQKIDIVYRRLVTKDLMDRYDEIPELIKGIKANKTCFIGNIRSQIVHTKLFFKVLHDERLKKYLSESEIDYINRHIPKTEKVIEVKNEYLENKDKYIIKPIDNYASNGVFTGRDLSDIKWKNKLNEILDKEYLIQEFCKPAYSENVIFKSENEFKREKFSNITGLFVYNESFYGLYSRAGLNSIISGLHDGYTLPSLYIEEKNNI